MGRWTSWPGMPRALEHRPCGPRPPLLRTGSRRPQVRLGLEGGARHVTDHTTGVQSKRDTGIGSTPRRCTRPRRHCTPQRVWRCSLSQVAPTALVARDVAAKVHSKQSK